MSSPLRPSGPGARQLLPALVVLVVVALLGGIPLARHLLDRRDQVLETNTRAPVSPQASTLRPKRVACDDARQDGLLEIPEGTRAIRVFPGYLTPGEAPRLEVEVSGGSVRLRGASPASYPPGAPLVIGLDRPAPRGLSKVCIRNTGDRTVTLARAVDAQGNDRAVPLDQGGPDGGTRTRDAVRVDMIGRRDALAVTLAAGGIDHASAYKPDGVGPVPIAAGLVLVLLLGGAAAVLVLRGPDDDDPLAPGAAAAVGPAPGTPATPAPAAHDETPDGEADRAL